MYNFKLPQSGEPWDVALLGQMASYITAINEKLLSQKSARSSLWGPVRSVVETPDTTIWTGRILLTSNTKPKASADTENWSATFNVPFKTVPIITATPYCNTSGGTIAPSAIWITEITNTGVKGKWKWLGTTSRPETLYALVIAVGEGEVV